MLTLALGSAPAAALPPGILPPIAANLSDSELLEAADGTYGSAAIILPAKIEKREDSTKIESSPNHTLIAF